LSETYLELVDSVDIRNGELSFELSVLRRQSQADKWINANELKL
jgi:hypothetical protein